MLHAEEKIARLALVDTLSISPLKQFKLLEHFGSAVAVFKAAQDNLDALGFLNAEQIQKILDFDPKIFSKKLAEIEKRDIKFVCHDEPDYPKRLLHTLHFPLVLFYRGDITLLSNDHVVSFVGTRDMTDYGQRVVKTLVTPLAENGAVIVSGMAMGIDAASHTACVDAGGKTVAIQAQGCERGHPNTNQRVYENILENNGCVISEFPWVAANAVSKFFFPRRNRLISGVSDAVVIVEADEKSGALITAKYALDQNRDVYAVPGNIDQPFSRGCLKIIRDGAHMVTDAASLMADLGVVDKSEPQQKLDLGLPRDWEKIKPSFELFLSPLEQKIFDSCQTEPRTMDEIIDLTDEAPPSISATITKLQIEGRVKEVAGRRFLAVGE